jgi:alkylation response protein AidB-like acyl-CoA dehydrogenase
MDAITSVPQAATVKPTWALPLKMTHTAGEATVNDSPILHTAIGLAEQIRAASEEIEGGRRIPPGIAQAMRDAGVFGMAMPRVWGGPELDPLTQFRVIEALAMAEGSVGWCAMINCDGGYVTAFLDQDVARAMYPDILVATGVATTTTGKAERVPGGYRVSGRFPFVSGCHHCEWLFAGCTVIENGVPQVDGNGVPETRQCLLAARTYYFDVMGDLWETLVDGSQPFERQLALFTTAYPHIVGVCGDVVQLVYKAAGGGAVYQKGPLDRCLRDVLTMNQHVLGTLRNSETAGRLLLGLEPLRRLL